MNNISIIGRLCHDPELKATTNGKYVTNFTVAVKRPMTKEDTDFLPVVLWGQNAEFISRYAQKGTRIAVSGVLTARPYEDKNGNKRTAFEIVGNIVEIVESKKDSNQPSEYAETAQNANFTTTADDSGFYEIGAEDDLPF